MHPQLLQGDDYGPVRLSDLDEDIRQGRVAPSARLYHPPLTGDAWVPLSELDRFADALDTPNARFTWYLRSLRIPWMSTAWTLFIAAAGTAWLVLLGAQAEKPWAAALVTDSLSSLPVGAGALIADGLWWTPWTSQLLHADPFHLLWNVGMIAYCGFRVERGLGPGGYLVVALASMAGGAALIALFGGSVVIGSSILAFGLWGGQIGIGVRTWGILPRRFRGRYGTSGFVFLFFAGLYASGFYSARISHLGHLGGLVAGLAVALVVPGESFAPAGRRGAWFRRNVALALGLLLLGSALGPALGASPRVAWRAWSTVEPEGSGLAVQLPQRLQPHELRVAGLPAWMIPGAGPTPVFAGLTSLTSPHLPTGEELTDWWSRKLGGTALPIPVGPEVARESPWRSYRWRIEDTVQLGTVELVEHHRARGRWVVRTGYLLPVLPELALPGGREALYEEIVATVEVAEPPSLADIRARHARNPRAPKLRYELAEELAFAGELVEADALLAELSEREDAWAWEAARLRLALWEEAPGLVEAESGLAWLAPFLREASLRDVDLHRPAVAWMLSRSLCEEVGAHRARLDEAVVRAGGRQEVRRSVVAMLEDFEGPLFACGPTASVAEGAVGAEASPGTSSSPEARDLQ